MALILNIETATTVCSVSLARDGELLSFKEQNGDYSHAENLTLFIEDVCKRANISLKDVDAIAVSKGPGSYTGLRIGVSTAKGLCYSLDKPLIAINTLKHLALSVLPILPTLTTPDSQLPTPDSQLPTPHSPLPTPDSQLPTPNSQLPTPNSPLPTHLCPMLDARRMEVYCAVYDSKGNEVRATAAEIIDENSFGEIFKTSKIVFFGDGAAKCKGVLSHNINAVFLDDIVPSAKDMIKLAEEAFNAKTFEDVAYFEPFYLKDFVAGKKKGEA